MLPINGMQPPVGPMGQQLMTMTGMPQQPAVMPAPVPAGGPMAGGAANPFMGNMLAQIAARRQAMQDWRGMRPELARPEGGWADPAARQAAMGDFRQQKQDWRGQRPGMQVGQMDFSKFGNQPR